jgi:hypothetical protein
MKMGGAKCLPPMTVPTKKDKTMLKKFCHDQVKILLERMETNPEEFAVVDGGKWDEFMPNQPRFKDFTKVEQYLIRKKFREIVKVAERAERQETYDAILETLVFKEETKTKRYYSTSNQPVLGTPVNTSEHIKLHQEVLHQAAKKLYRTSS